VTPEAQQTTSRPDGFDLGDTVGLVHGPTTDPDAERVVRETLTRAGVQTVVDGEAAVTIRLGGGGPDVDGLPAEGYVVAVGDHQVVLDGVDARGTFYAAQAFA